MRSNTYRAGEAYLSAILNHVENLGNGLIKEPGCAQMPGCELSKTSPRRPQDVTKKYLYFIIYSTRLPKLSTQ